MYTPTPLGPAQTMAFLYILCTCLSHSHSPHIHPPLSPPSRAPAQSCFPSPELLKRIHPALLWASLALCQLSWHGVHSQLETISPRVGAPSQELWHLFLIFFLQNHIRTVGHKCSLNRFTLGCEYGMGEWSRETTGIQGPQERMMLNTVGPPLYHWFCTCKFNPKQMESI